MRNDNFVKNNNIVDHDSVGYIKRRKRAIIMFFSSIYLFCLLFILLKFGIIRLGSNKLWALINILNILFNIISIIHMDITKRVYKNIAVSNYNEINVLTKRETLILILPVVISAYFIFLQVMGCLIFIGGIYITVDKFNRPYDPIEDSRYGTREIKSEGRGDS
jgi:hypothetical protein